MNFYLDFEAAQFSNRIISIGCATDNNVYFYSLVKPEGKKKVGKLVAAMTNIKDEDLIEAPSADEVFIDFWNWVVDLYCKNPTEEPIRFYTYGSNDKDFLDTTIRHMKYPLAILMARGIKDSIVDYSKIVTEKLGATVALCKVYKFLTKSEEEQNHNALDDARMLKYVADHIGDYAAKDAEEISRIKKVSMRSEGKKVTDKYKSWFGLSHGQLFNTNTWANKDNWYIKLSLGNKDKYFLNLKDTAMWVIAYCHLGSPKDEKNVNKIMKNINDALNNNGKVYNFKWERNGNYA